MSHNDVGNNLYVQTKSRNRCLGTEEKSSSWCLHPRGFQPSPIFFFRQQFLNRLYVPIGSFETFRALISSKLVPWRLTWREWSFASTLIGVSKSQLCSARTRLLKSKFASTYSSVSPPIAMSALRYRIASASMGNASPAGLPSDIWRLGINTSRWRNSLWLRALSPARSWGETTDPFAARCPESSVHQTSSYWLSLACFRADWCWLRITHLSRSRHRAKCEISARLWRRQSG